MKTPYAYYVPINQKLHTFILIASISIALIAGLFGVYMFRQYESIRASDAGSQNSAAEIDTLVRTISTFMELPKEEVPTLATVTDVTKLGNNPFFAEAQNGDKVLIFAKAARAILYRPSAKKIINVSVFTPQQPANLTHTSATPAPDNITIAIRNGTTVTGLTVQYVKELKRILPDAVVVDTDAAKNRNYQDSMIIDVARTHTSDVKRIAKALDMAVGELPGDEGTVSAEYLIILGADKSGLK